MKTRRARERNFSMNEFRSLVIETFDLKAKFLLNNNSGMRLYF